MSTRFRKPPVRGGRPSPPLQKNLSGQNRMKQQILQPIAPNVVISSEVDQPISDFPTPPVQISSCRHAQQGEMIPLPKLSTAPHDEIPQLTLQKLKQCNRICDFSDPSIDSVSKATKIDTLKELIECYSNPKTFQRLPRECHQALIEMFANNVFRPPPNIPRALMISDEVTIEDTAWPHLSLVYNLFLKFLDCQVDPRILQFQITIFCRTSRSLCLCGFCDFLIF